MPFKMHTLLNVTNPLNLIALFNRAVIAASPMIEVNDKSKNPKPASTVILTRQHDGELEKEAETRSWGQPLFPRLIPLSRGVLIIEPWDPMINQEVEIDREGLEEAILPVGKPFSRIWNHNGIWRPVGI